MKKSILCVLVLMAISSFLSAQTHKAIIFGAEVVYKSSSQVTVREGSGRCNGSMWEITSEIDVDLSSVLPAGEDFLYIYIDDSASSYPTPTIVGSTTEPSFSSSQYGWYSGNDRCIGVVWCDSYGNIVDFQNNRNQEYILVGAYLKTVLSNGNPSGSNQTVETTAYIPVNANAVFVTASNSDTSASITVQVSPYENGGAAIKQRGYNTKLYAIGWLTLQRGWSRDLKWLGENDDDNSFEILIHGYRLER